ncbi:nuclear receptor coactivator 7 isoform X4 [Gadus morhua]|uniref:nuclear receptor coactivator 7 isoform X4 n=1 Tax=Gadus morhua TaxID=8049 RepID=UPI0011B4B94A|nr:nuclear receptor coactivator 7-like isoform X4 [Gadus morhua]
MLSLFERQTSVMECEIMSNQEQSWLKKRRQLKQSISEKNAHEQNPAHPLPKSPLISCPDAQNGAEPTDRAEKAGEPQSRKAAKPPSDSADSLKAVTQTKREKRRPPGTVEFTVGLDDTLNSIALRFNITPNKLVQLNKLFARSVYTGQKLFVPDLSQSETAPQPAENGTQEGVSDSRPAKPIQRHASPPSEDESPTTVKFIKMSCKYFTDGMGVVGGVLIVTPNNIMFDPHKSDPLVIEHGCEEYGLICPMEEVVSVALYDDVSRMKLKDAPPSPGEWEQLPSVQDLNPFSRYQALETKGPIFLDDISSNYSECDPKVSPLQCNPYGALRLSRTTAREDCGLVDKTPSDEGFTELEPTLNGSGDDPDPMAPAPPNGGQQAPAGPPTLDPEEEPTACRTEEEEDEGVAPNSSVEDAESLKSSAETEKRRVASREAIDAKDGNAATSPGSQGFVSCDTKGRQDPVLSRSDSGSGVEADGKDGREGLASQEKPQGEASGLSAEERRKKTYKAEMKSWLLERMQAPIQDMLQSSEEKSKKPPMFLCFKLGKPMRKSFAVAMNSSPAHSYGGRGKQPEYWFAVPQERVDHLYGFFVQWSPDVYGKEAREQGFVVVDEMDMVDNFFSDPASCSWEIITVDEAKRRQSFSSFEADLSLDALPLLGESSALLQDTHVEKLASRLPARVQGYLWRLAYSSQNHGTSLKTLYRNLLELDSPVLLVLKDMDNQIFGAFSSHPFRVSEHYYGTGETFLYSFCPEIKVYRWTGDNSYFVKGNIDSLQFGGGGGQLGLWLDAELYRGTTSGCATFDNQALSAQRDFNIHSVEVWTFE